MAKRSTPPATPARSATSRFASRGRLDALVSLLTGAIVLARLLTPTEGAVVGETLWIVQVSLFALLVWVFACFRAGEFEWRLDWIDAGVFLIGLGQLTGALFGWGEANRRASLNMVWEWCGLVVTWMLIRRVASRAAERQSLVLAVMAAAAALSGLGIWQHYVGLPETRREVQAVQNAWDELQERGRPGDPRAAVEWDLAVQRLRGRFIEMGIPSDDASRALWDYRLNASTEPFGAFALANTFAGLLAFALVLWVAGLASSLSLETARWHAIGFAAGATLIGFCLVLTKSRTAWVGLSVGMVAGFCALQFAAGPSRRSWRWVALGIVGVALLVGLAAATGGLDRLVLSEAFKSLSYRGEYWTATWRMLTARWPRALLGVGPGNFRSFYLEYKLPESSEEIADPHNLFLDIWSGGGLIGLAGLCLLLGACVRPLLRRQGSAGAEASAASAAAWRDPVLLGAAGAFVVAYLMGLLDEAAIPLLVGSGLAVSIGLGRRLPEVRAPLLAAAGLAMIVHLLGAGGIAMPAITQLLFLPAAVGGAVAPPAAWTRKATSSLAGGLVAAAALALYLGCWFTATIPVMTARSYLAAGDQALVERIERAERQYRNAAEADPVDPVPCERLAHLYLQRWLAAEEDDRLFQESVLWESEAIRRKPHDYGGYRARGALYLTRADRTHDPADAGLAADEFAQAVALYPQHAETQSELAEALWRGKRLEAARTFARQALDLDTLNRRNMHLDKLLSAKRKELMETIWATQPAKQE